MPPRGVSLWCRSSASRAIAARSVAASAGCRPAARRRTAPARAAGDQRFALRSARGSGCCRSWFGSFGVVDQNMPGRAPESRRAVVAPPASQRARWCRPARVYSPSPASDGASSHGLSASSARSRLMRSSSVGLVLTSILPRHLEQRLDAAAGRLGQGLGVALDPGLLRQAQRARSRQDEPGFVCRAPLQAPSAHRRRRFRQSGKRIGRTARSAAPSRPASARQAAQTARRHARNDSGEVPPHRPATQQAAADAAHGGTPERPLARHYSVST